MKESHLISVIVPVYNVEAYIERCIESIINQTYTNLEIILVDDGSKDRSGSICDDFADIDSRIRVIHKSNGGLSDARNYALEVMTGEYVTCIDSDDFVSPFYIMNLYTAIINTESSIACSWFVDYYDGDKLLPSKINDGRSVQIFNRLHLYEKLLYQDGVETSAWGKLYKSNLFEGVRYPVGKLYEDIPTIYELFEKVDKIVVLPNVDYFYYQRSNSIAKSKFNIRKMDAIVHMSEMKDKISKKYPSLRLAAECRYFSTVCNIYFQVYGQEYCDVEKKLWSEIKGYRKSILYNRQGRVKARLAAVLSYLGPSFMRVVYRKLVRK